MSVAGSRSTQPSPGPGRDGIAQVDTDGLVCAAFDHRESRSGDPDLHTHVAVANKVPRVDGRWRSLDASALFGLGVAASERYSTQLEDALARRFRVRFEERPGRVPGMRPVREVVGVPPTLLRHFSRRRTLIEVMNGTGMVTSFPFLLMGLSQIVMRPRPRVG